MPPRCSCSAIPSSITSTSSLWQASIKAAGRAPAQQTQINASFSTTASREYNSKARRQFWHWLSRQGVQFKKPSPDGRTNYLNGKNTPFPLNPNFASRPVLTDGARDLIWSKVIEKGETVKAVSAELGIDINRVAAVVRLKEVEKDWLAKGKEMAIPYARAIANMLPLKSYKVDERNTPLEPINELHVHPHTMKQLYWPTSESRQFTREDAAKAFHRNMLSADARIPHPELVQMERDLLQKMSPAEARAKFIESTRDAERKAAEARAKKAQQEEQTLQRVNTKRFEFRFKKINAEDVGNDGRKITAIGARYGRPSYDRVKGAVKIPTSVP
ncbi:hypothetical protein PFICI_02822 [Pestalotiopsis fici W106-1]|uniref:Uncharacterized protein n=1 Tax=Pestalotiopsis fici (strain W106-1 / CGMCC3.15140) TaxID=1229662 RepID=W3XHA2_PESFW|nr:uncharacterized protein PFICI_02822 [Pestalotiopsis fici W106-1]ETS84797.1 hypothetical protein PFICI_02822 [Pestalotiopsis fici W106-1]